MSKLIDLTGQRFGRLIAIKRVEDMVDKIGYSHINGHWTMLSTNLLRRKIYNGFRSFAYAFGVFIFGLSS